MSGEQLKHNSSPPSGTLEACTGCGACAAACPVSCITMQPNDEGFLCPVIDASICTDCGICRHICPVNPEKISDGKALGGGGFKPLAVFAAWHVDEDIRKKSSSGGAFTALAENILAQGGTVAGAALDDQLVVRHILVETSEELYRLRGSKYVQSEIAPALYPKIRDLLKQGRLVLFSGTPCQVAGLRGFLRQPYETLFCCDLICHGVPSPLFFKRYVQNNTSPKNQLLKIDFRDKTTGWKTFGVRQHYQKGSDKTLSMWSDSYLAAFLHNYDLRECCYACHFKTIEHHSDIVIADFWGVQNKYPDYDREDKGTSLLLVNTEKGKVWLDACRLNLFLGTADLDTAVTGNPMIISSSSRPYQRNTFYNDLKTLSFKAMIRKYGLYKPSLLRRAIVSIKRRFVVISNKIIGINKMKGSI